LIRPKTYEL
jgi:hypothetical protein